MNSDDSIDFSIFNKLAKDSLIKNLNTFDGIKYVVVDTSSLKLLDCFVSYSEITKFGVEKVFKIEDTIPRNIENNQVKWIYVIRPDVDSIKLIVKQINDDLKQGPIKTKRNILFLPHKNYIFEEILEREGVYEYFSIDELENSLIRLDTNVLSMECLYFYKNYYLNGDQTLFTSIAKSLILFETLLGSFNNIHLYGNSAKLIYKLMQKLNDKKYNSTDPFSKIGHLILIDRSVDFVTPFTTQLNYEGLLDDIYGIVTSQVEIPNETNTNIKHKLTNEDVIFKDIRYNHISEVIMSLKNKIQEIQEAKDRNLESISAMKDYVQNNLKDIVKIKERLANHLKLCETVIQKKGDILPFLQIEHKILIGNDYKTSIQFIEEMIARKYDMYSILSLMILLSVTNDGISQKDFNLLTNQFLHSYGYEKIILLNRLQKIGLFTTNESIIKEDSKLNLLKTDFTAKIVQQFAKVNKLNNYENIKKKLNIIPNPTKLQNYDLSRLYNSNYRPIICKYIEQILSVDRNNMQNLKEFQDIFPGEYEFIPSRNVSARSLSYDTNKTILIYFIGGCTFAEIATFKLLEKQKGFKFYYATTGFINSKTILKSLDETINI